MPRKSKSEQGQPVVDSWANYISGLGTSRDKRQHNRLLAWNPSYDPTYFEELWASDDIAARIVETLPGEMCREFVSVNVAGEPETGQAIDTALDELEAASKFQEAMEVARALGGSAIVVGANDGGMEGPIDLARLRSVDWLTVYDSREIRPVRKYQGGRKHGEPEVYEVRSLTPEGDRSFLVHADRVIPFQGVRVTSRLRNLTGWGRSVLERPEQVIADFQLTWGAIASLAQEASVGVFQIEGLAQLLAGDGTAFRQRMEALDVGKSTARSMVLAGGRESFTRVESGVGALAPIMQQFALRLAAAAKMPVSLLLGQAPAGLNATGDADTRWFYDQVSASQRTILRPALNRLVRLLLLSKQGPTQGKEPESWSVNPRPLWQMSESETADLRSKQSETDSKYIAAGVVTPQEVRRSRFGGDKYSIETTLDDSQQQ